MQTYSVITGDIVSSSKLENKTRDELFSSLKEIFRYLESTGKYAIDKPFEISRGDFFQGILLPEYSLEASLLILTQIKKLNPYQDKNDKLTVKLTPLADLRISIGTGEITYSKEKIIESDGEAFRNSGRFLDKSNKNAPRIMITSSKQSINEELEVYAWMLDAIINKWSIKSAEVINYSIKGYKQYEVARQLKISQPSVKGRLDAASWHAIYKLLTRYSAIMKNI